MIIGRNLHAISLNRIVKFRNWEVEKTTEKVATGLRINRAKDDAAGLAVSEKMGSQIRGLRQAERNAEDGLSTVQTAESYLEATSEILQRIRTLAVQSSNGTYSDADRGLIQQEVVNLIDEVDRIASQAQFNTMNLFDGRFSRLSSEGGMVFHLGPNKDHRETVYIEDMSSKGLDLRGAPGNLLVDLSTGDSANETIGIIDHALNRLTKQRADLGGNFTRLEQAARNLMSSHASIQSAASITRDADVAEEMVANTRDRIILESGQAQLAQSLQSPAGLMKLLRSNP
jgi:flagellin